MVRMLAYTQKILIIFLLSFLIFPAIGWSASKKGFKSVVELIESEDYQGAYETLTKLKGKDEAIEKRIDYLIGHTTLRLEKFDLCLDYFGKGVNEYPELADYSDYNISRCYAAAGRFKEASVHLEEFAKRHPDSRLVERVTFDLAKYYLLAADGKKGLNTLDHFVKRYPNSEYIPEAYFLRGGELERLGRLADAYEDYRTIYYKYPISPLNAQALSRTISISRNKDIKTEATSIRLRKGRVDILFKNRRYDLAIKDINERVIPALKGREKGEMLILLAKCYILTGQKGKAIELLKRYIEEYPKGRGVAEATYSIGRLYWNMGRTDDALNYMNLIVTSFNGDEYDGMATYVIGRIYERQGGIDKAVESYQKLITGKHKDTLVESAYWQIGWIFYMEGRYNDMAILFQEAIERYPESSLRNAYRYWMGRSYEKLGEKAKAVSIYSAVSDYPSFYYSSLSRNRLAALGVKLKKEVVGCSYFKEGFDDFVSASREGNPSRERRHLKKALELAELGFKEDARLELELAKPLFNGDEERMWFLSLFYERLGFHNKAIVIRNDLFFSKVKNGAESMPTDKLRHIYPLGYWKEIVKYSKKNKIDPFMSLSIVRQESKFDRDALSTANARGLMQLIPSTGEKMYKQVYGKDFDPELLFDPEINISLGTLYFSQLVERFDGNVVAAIASYNAGPIPAKRWLEEFKGLPTDEFIENIPYPQTKGYLNKVLGNYYSYKRLYPKESGCAKDNI